MATETAIKKGHPIYFGVLILFSIVLMSISAFLVDRYNSDDSFLSEGVSNTVRYILFCSLWTIVTASAYLVGFLAVPMGSGGVLLSVASHLIWVVLTFCIWLAGAAAITAELGGGVSCKFADYTYCHHLNAILGLTWIDTVLIFLAMIVIIVISVRSRSSSGPISA
ncbi:hypothetical protein E3P92_03073 [Wallemia ichthyophaga]|uniref:MARVEL domain-containing protein n=2 Tax=Wallemia ichthyophaga TaxID=245174 RepID=A0A4T0I0P1_WALIC|nr:uncharacterized protein J056_000479 [Wallemia ichthyophaga EXF-994]TIB10047.1 hypothetical protein E3P90_03000 [Wallemia ichthyophaga]EOR00669.1 hypothetical protein J056_000479 [Wallemia ichthyophaga EXF-994]TIB10085.1 hypothetical protein E3P93_03004 [Wallemia ichthyophaga]TIB10859.1 hypothetical protein E3P92_03073 [Wallemia ichthyophaga]TIB20824.1 hypothetical protein E3P89_02979 [Wallemia ichthyophaga]